MFHPDGYQNPGIGQGFDPLGWRGSVISSGEVLIRGQCVITLWLRIHQDTAGCVTAIRIQLAQVSLYYQSVSLYQDTAGIVSLYCQSVSLYQDTAGIVSLYSKSESLYHDTAGLVSLYCQPVSLCHCATVIQLALWACTFSLCQGFDPLGCIRIQLALWACTASLYHCIRIQLALWACTVSLCHCIRIHLALWACTGSLSHCIRSWPCKLVQPVGQSVSLCPDTAGPVQPVCVTVSGYSWLCELVLSIGQSVSLYQYTSVV